MTSKKIFYYTDVLPILAREGAAIEKLKRSLKIFQESAEEIRLVWHPYPQTIEYLEKNHSTVLEDYERILSAYRQDNWGDLDESASLESARQVLLSCHAYYGDVSDLVADAQNAGLPVMLQDIDR